MKRCITLSLASAAFAFATAATAPAAHADSASVAEHKRQLDAAGGAGVPASWDPLTAPAPKKPASLMPKAALATAAVASRSLVANQVPQQTSYWCGPAAVHEALNARGIGTTQSGLASALGTTTNGTAWYTGSSYPVPTTLNNKLGNAYYYPTNVSYSPTSTEKATFQTDLVSDIDNGYFEARGYADYGASTMYEDSVHGATSVSWSASVPAYSTLSSSTITTIVGGRGYVW